MNIYSTRRDATRGATRPVNTRTRSGVNRERVVREARYEERGVPVYTRRCSGVHQVTNTHTHHKNQPKTLGCEYARRAEIQGGGSYRLTFTKYSFVDSGIVHYSIRFWAPDHSCIAPLVCCNRYWAIYDFLLNPLFCHLTYTIGVGIANIVSRPTYRVHRVALQRASVERHRLLRPSAPFLHGTDGL